MSLVPRLILAAISALFGVVMVLAAPPTDKAWFFYVFGGFCFAIAVACLVRGRAAQFFGSLVAAGIMVASIGYSALTLVGGEVTSGRRSQPSFLNSIGFLLAFGVPAAMYLWSARFGLRKAPKEQAQSENAES
jgi:hypothetical protein